MFLLITSAIPLLIVFQDVVVDCSTKQFHVKGEEFCCLLSDDVQVQLCRHVLRTVCTDIVNQALSLLAADHMITINDDSAFTPEV